MRVPWAERGVAMHNDAALNWLAGRGFQPHEPAPTLHLFADEVAQSGFLLRRFWVSGLSATVRADPAARDRFTATFALEGEAVIDGHLPDAAMLGSGMLLVRDCSQPLRIDSVGPLALIQIESEWSRLLGIDRAGDRPILAAESFAQIFASLATVVLNSSVTPSDGGFGYVRRAIESTLSAVLIQSAATSADAITSSAQRRLFQRAAAYIESNAENPDFSLEDITRYLAVSKTYLQRAFRAAGTTPLRYLQRTRAQNARALMSAHPFTARTDLERIARQTGFNSLETMRSVIARELGPDRDR
ncbi:helix-turn-helix domain-containing protein [Microbacteriaceae bacterium VKM Ac-2854]|nr:helix-turn-helix domain-containing protein [Microbacteriaceae bacterium VKM Ac-2854]